MRLRGKSGPGGEKTGGGNAAQPLNKVRCRGEGGGTAVRKAKKGRHAEARGPSRQVAALKKKYKTRDTRGGKLAVGSDRLATY